ncbi:MAG: hypothetical protein FWF20_01535 [Betaproteobacteria bacterium]|nr:hypothetical protein [Betaproteobacteria bacterium]MCL2885464.1 hypothetical protein [Betaproteobacteria bacterium]
MAAAGSRFSNPPFRESLKKMQCQRTLTALALAVALAGCATPYSEAPTATNFSSSKQSKLQAAAHWKIIADDTARQIAAGLGERQALYVNVPEVKSEFDRAFANQLIAALIAQGFVVQKTPQGALNVDIDTQAVRFAANRPQYAYVGAPTLLAAGVWALHSVHWSAAAATVGTLGAVGLDAYAWFRSEFATGETPQTEIIVTATVSNREQYLARATSVYYVADADQGLYQAPLPAKSLPLVGGR